MEAVEVAQSADVILGSGEIKMHHSGNVAFRLLMEKNCDRYFHPEGSRVDKTYYITKIMKSVFRAGGRFLKQSKRDAKWYPVCKDGCRSKVSDKQFRILSGLLQNDPVC